jgi:hypothetical protein
MARIKRMVGSPIVGKPILGRIGVGTLHGSSGSSGTGTAPTFSFLLLRNGVDKILLRDGVSKLRRGH